MPTPPGLAPRDITTRNSVTITLDDRNDRVRASVLLTDTAKQAELLSGLAEHGSAERYGYAEVAFELRLAARKLAAQ